MDPGELPDEPTQDEDDGQVVDEEGHAAEGLALLMEAAGPDDGGDHSTQGPRKKGRQPGPRMSPLLAVNTHHGINVCLAAAYRDAWYPNWDGNNALPCRVMMEIDGVLQEDETYDCRLTMTKQQRQTFVRGLSLRKKNSSLYGKYHRGWRRKPDSTLILVATSAFLPVLDPLESIDTNMPIENWEMHRQASAAAQAEQARVAEETGAYPNPPFETFEHDTAHEVKRRRKDPASSDQQKQQRKPQQPQQYQQQPLQGTVVQGGNLPLPGLPPGVQLVTLPEGVLSAGMPVMSLGMDSAPQMQHLQYQQLGDQMVQVITMPASSGGMGHSGQAPRVGQPIPINTPLPGQSHGAGPLVGQPIPLKSLSVQQQPPLHQQHQQQHFAQNPQVHVSSGSGPPGTVNILSNGRIHTVPLVQQGLAPSGGGGQMLHHVHVSGAPYQHQQTVSTLNTLDLRMAADNPEVMVALLQDDGSNSGRQVVYTGANVDGMDMDNLMANALAGSVNGREEGAKMAAVQRQALQQHQKQLQQQQLQQQVQQLQQQQLQVQAQAGPPPSPGGSQPQLLNWLANHQQAVTVHNLQRTLSGQASMAMLAAHMSQGMGEVPAGLEAAMLQQHLHRQGSLSRHNSLASNTAAAAQIYAAELAAELAASSGMVLHGQRQPPPPFPAGIDAMQQELAAARQQQQVPRQPIAAAETGAAAKRTLVPVQVLHEVSQESSLSTPRNPPSPPRVQHAGQDAGVSTARGGINAPDDAQQAVSGGVAAPPAPAPPSASADCSGGVGAASLPSSLLQALESAKQGFSGLREVRAIARGEPSLLRVLEPLGQVMVHVVGVLSGDVQLTTDVQRTAMQQMSLDLCELCLDLRIRVTAAMEAATAAAGAGGSDGGAANGASSTVSRLRDVSTGDLEACAKVLAMDVRKMAG